MFNLEISVRKRQDLDFIGRKRMSRLSLASPFSFSLLLGLSYTSFVFQPLFFGYFIPSFGGVTGVGIFFMK